MEVLRRCPLAIAQRLVHRAIALSTAVLDRVTKTMSVAPLLMNNLARQLEAKDVQLAQPSSTSLLMISSFWAKVRVQLHLPPHDLFILGKSEGPAPPPSSKISWSFDLAWSPVGVEQQQAIVYIRMTVESLVFAFSRSVAGGGPGSSLTVRSRRKSDIAWVSWSVVLFRFCILLWYPS